MWLLGQLAPDHNTIANFHKRNAKAIIRLFRATVKVARHFELVGGELLAGDSTKLRAQNSKKNNYNRGKIVCHCLLIDYQVTNHNDSKAMGNKLRRAKSIVGNSSFTALLDKGYYTGSELEVGQKLGITTLVAIPAPAANAPDPAYNVEHFTYDPGQDIYTCPEGHTLTTNGSVYTKHRGKTNQTSFHQYRTKACKTCAARARRTTAKNGKLIERNLYSPLFEENRQRIAANPELYKRRQAIVEHPFGTIKRQWGYSYVLTKKGMERASADVGLMLVAYNLRRLFNMVGLAGLRAYWSASLNMLWAMRAMFEVHWRAFNHRIKVSPPGVLYFQNAIFN